jgi:hypothetical protein
MKFFKGGEATTIRVTYTENGQSMEIASKIPIPGIGDLLAEATWISIQEHKRRKALRYAPSEAERQEAFFRRYEARIGQLPVGIQRNAAGLIALRGAMTPEQLRTMTLSQRIFRA